MKKGTASKEEQDKVNAAAEARAKVHAKKLARELDVYKFFGVSETALTAEIKKSFNAMAIKLHPDRNKGASKIDMARNVERFHQATEAWSVLKNPGLRGEYDAELQKVRQRKESGQSPSSSPNQNNDLDDEKIAQEEAEVAAADKKWAEEHAAEIAAEKIRRAAAAVAAARAEAVAAERERDRLIWQAKQLEINRKKFLVFLVFLAVGFISLIALVFYVIHDVKKREDDERRESLRPKIASKIRFYIKGNRGENKQISIDAQIVAKLDNSILINNGISLSKYPTDDEGFYAVECEVVDLRSDVWDVNGCVGPGREFDIYEVAKPYSSAELTRSTVAAEWFSPAPISNKVQEEPKLDTVRPEPKPNVINPDEKSDKPKYKCVDSHGVVIYKYSVDPKCGEGIPNQEKTSGVTRQESPKHALVTFDNSIPNDERVAIQELADTINFGTEADIESKTNGGIQNQFGYLGYGDLSSKGPVTFIVERTKLTDGRKIEVKPHSYEIHKQGDTVFSCDLQKINNRWQFKNCYWYEPEPESGD